MSEGRRLMIVAHIARGERIRIISAREMTQLKEKYMKKKPKITCPTN